MTDIFKEVDEELRQEHYKKLWDKYGRYVIAAAVALVLAVGGYQAWQAWQERQRESASNQYGAALSLLEEGRSEEAETALAALGGPGDGGYAILASLQSARLKAEAGDLEGAVAIRDALAANQSAGAAFRGAATLLSVTHQIDSGDPAELEARLQPLTEVGQAFRPPALELSALIALRNGDQEKAQERYAAIVDDIAAPTSLRTRASQMLTVLGGGS